LSAADEEKSSPLAERRLHGGCFTRLPRARPPRTARAKNRRGVRRWCDGRKSPTIRG